MVEARLRKRAAKLFADRDVAAEVVAAIPGWLADLTDPDRHAIGAEAAGDLVDEAFDLRRDARGPMVKFLAGCVRIKGKEFRSRPAAPRGNAGHPVAAPGPTNLPDPGRQAAEKAARARADAEAEVADAGRKARWEGLPAGRREAIMSEVAEAYPALRKWPGVMMPHYLDAMDRPAAPAG